MAETMLMVEIAIKPGKVVGEDGEQVYELLAGNALTHFTKLGGVSR